MLFVKNMISIIWAFVSWLRYPLFGIAIFILIFYILVYLNIIIGLIKGQRFKKGEHYKVKEHGFFRKLFIDLPHRISQDRFSRDPEFFKYQGLIIYEGRQGNGKTIAMMYDARRMIKEYPKAKCLCNIDYKFQDETLDDWTKLVDYKNGIYGIVAIMDELQNWFSSNQSKNFPPEMLQVITQNRKNRRVILGTSQNFYLLAKAIRSQATEVRRCATFFGAVTIVRKFEPVLDSEGNVVEFKRRGWYWFVHDEELRNSYDTYHVVESLRKSGFQERALPGDTIVHNTVLINNKNKGK